MTVTLVVEDGSVVANANTYASRAYAIEYAANRGVTFLDSEATDILLLQAMDYFLQFTQQWKGFLVSPNQTLAFPRQGVILYDVGDYGLLDGSENNLVNGWENFLPFGIGSYIPSDTVPKNIKDAQVAVALAINKGIDVLPNVGGATLPIVKEVVGPLETDYARPVDMAGIDWYSVRLPVVDALLALLLRASGGLRSQRI